VVNAIASHHHEAEQESIEAVIAEAADAISGARPGARREDLEAYIKRIKSLEELANPSMACSKPSPSRPGAKCASSSAPKISTT
jgi:HD superfamily phosphodiesterase